MTWLLGSGRRPWAEVRRDLADFECAWADEAGMQVGAPPPDPPISSHLWGWAEDGTLARARVDRDEAILGLLVPAPVDGGREVDVVVRPIVGLDPADRRLPDVASTSPVLGRRFEVVEVQDLLAFWFVRPAPSR